MVGLTTTLLAISVAFLTSPPSTTFWTPQDEGAISDALRILNMTPRDLEFSKKPRFEEAGVSEDPLTSPLIERLLHSPLETAGTSASLAREISDRHRAGRLDQLLQNALRAMNWTEGVRPAVEATDPLVQEKLMGLPPAARDALNVLLPRLTAARRNMTKAIDSLTDSERDLIIKHEAPTIVSGDLWKKVDQGLLFSAARQASKALQQAATLLAAVPAHLWPKGDPQAAIFGAEGDVITTFLSPIGTVVIGGSGLTTYTAPHALVIDVGGDDLYRGPVAAGSFHLPLSAVLDLRGNDRYLSTVDRSQGCGVLGIGILIDLSGEDVYTAESTSQGCGHFGVGVLWDRQGRDHYLGKQEVQGSGRFGIGALLDDEGDDQYRAAQMAQAYAWVQGVGMLSDLEGQDEYFAGGVQPHAPLLPDRFRSLSQGCAFGERFAHGGGLALLVDAQGSDHYIADIFGQGLGYGPALGLLVDFNGHDTYTLTQYGQGSGMHSGIGALVDLAGDDSYLAAHGVSQGTGDDHAVGCLVDLGGNDRYIGSRLSQGAAKDLGVGFFFDREGRDAYLSDRKNPQGYASPVDGMCGVGIFIDRDAAQDLFSGPSASLVTRNPSPPLPPKKWPTNGLPQDPERLFELASRRPGESPQAAIEGAKQKLIDGGQKTLNFLIPEKLLPKDPTAIGGRSTPHRNLLGTLLQGIGSPLAVPALLTHLDHPHPKIRRAVIELLASLEATEAGPLLLKRLEVEEGPLAILCIKTLGSLRISLAVQPLVERLPNTSSEEERLAIVTALGAFKDTAALPALLRVLETDLITVRSAAVNAIVACQTGAAPSILALLRSAHPQLRLHGFELAGKTRCETAEAEIRKGFTDPDWVVRGYAARAARHIHETQFRDALDSLKKSERHPFVLSQLP